MAAFELSAVAIRRKIGSARRGSTLPTCCPQA